MADTIHICDFRSEPKEKECLEAVWSMGESCEDCYRECYRKGWDANPWVFMTEYEVTER